VADLDLCQEFKKIGKGAIAALVAHTGPTNGYHNLQTVEGEAWKKQSAEIDDRMSCFYFLNIECRTRNVEG
jgi:hypothetical protein